MGKKLPTLNNQIQLFAFGFWLFHRWVQLVSAVPLIFVEGFICTRGALIRIFYIRLVITLFFHKEFFWGDASLFAIRLPHALF